MTSILFGVFYRFYDNFMRTFQLDDHQAIVSRVEALAGKRQLNVADIGGGTGVLAHTLIELGHDVTIIDPAKKMTAIAQKRNSQITIINEPLEKISSGQAYDVIILRDCFHHIKAQGSALVKIYQLLQDEGLLIIQEFSPESSNAKLLFMLERCLLEKIYPLHPSALAAMMTRTGFNSTIFHLNSRDYLATGIKESAKEKRPEVET